MEAELRMSVEPQTRDCFSPKVSRDLKLYCSNEVEVAGSQKLLTAIAGGVRCLRDKNRELATHSSSHLPQGAVG